MRYVHQLLPGTFAVLLFSACGSATEYRTDAVESACDSLSATAAGSGASSITDEEAPPEIRDVIDLGSSQGFPASCRPYAMTCARHRVPGRRPVRWPARRAAQALLAPV